MQRGDLSDAKAVTDHPACVFRTTAALVGVPWWEFTDSDS